VLRSKRLFIPRGWSVSKRNDCYRNRTTRMQRTHKIEL
jgi:hypothetical protein